MAAIWSAQRRSSFSNALLILGLGIGLAAFDQTASAHQNQQPDAGQSADTQNAPPQALPESAPGQEQQQPQGEPGAPPTEPQDAQPGPPQQAPPNQALPPQTLTIPAGSVIRLRADDWISSDRNLTGDNFSAELDQPLVVDGWVVARRGQAQTGRVSLAKKGKIGETSELGLDLPTLTLVDGQQLPLETELFQLSGGHSGTTGRDVATVGGTTGLGAVIGGIAGGGTGAAIGAGLGATAGIVGVMSTKGRPTVIRPETVLSFRLKSPVTISTGNSQFAFRPVTQSDYDSRPAQTRRRMTRPGPPPPPPPYYPYPYAYAYPYPYGWYGGPFVGFGYYRGGWR